MFSITSVFDIEPVSRARTGFGLTAFKIFKTNCPADK